MKAVLINVHNETVQQVEVDDRSVLKDWYKHVGCQVVTVAHYFNDKDSVLVDDEGLFNLDEDSKFFSVKGGHQPFSGNGLVVGVNPENGESVGPHIGVEEIRSMVKFHTLNEVRLMM